jgi:hypothetical protein
MKKIMVFFILFCCSIWAQTIFVDDIVGAKKFLSEQEIFTTLQKNKDNIALEKQDWQKLKDAGFSEEFLDKLQNFFQEAAIPLQESPLQDSEPWINIEVVIQPKNSGSVIFTPALTQGKIKQNTVVNFKPQEISPYLFDHWEGDLRGYHSMDVKVSKNLKAIAVFKEPIKESPPPKIEDPIEFQDTRKQGHIYQGKCLGVVEGRGSNKDWGIETEVEFKYIYSMEYDSDVLSNNGYQIQENRTFQTVNETLLLSKYNFRLNIREDLEPVMNFVKGVSAVAQNFTPTASYVLSAAEMADNLLAYAEKITVPAERIEQAFFAVEKTFGKNKTLEDLKAKILNPRLGKILGYAPNLKLLEGKQFGLVYEDGIGLIHVKAMTPGTILNTREKELLQRAFYLSDYYISRDKDDPKRKIKPGDSWTVDARTLSGVLDPRLRHQVQGTILLTRQKDTVVEKKTMAIFSLKKGSIELLPPSDKKKIEGDVCFSSGELLYDLGLCYVAQSDLKGNVHYKEISTDHLLFKSRLYTTPTIQIHYECTCQKKEQQYNKRILFWSKQNESTHTR